MNAAVVEASGEKKSKLFINIISVVVPIVVVILLAVEVNLGEWTKNLTHVIGAINTLTTVALVLGFVFIKMRRVGAHRAMMTVSFSLGALFLVCYVLYHLSNPPNRFTGEGAARYVYLVLLATHIGLSFIVLPLVLRAMFYAVTGQFAAHKKIARFAYPIWLYVSASGVVVYLMLYHLYPTK